MASRRSSAREGATDLNLWADGVRSSGEGGKEEEEEKEEDSEEGGDSHRYATDIAHKTAPGFS